MLTYSIVWVALAAAVIVIAMNRRTATNLDRGDVPAGESGKGLAVFAIGYGLLLLAGFVYVSWQHGLELIK
ncbi:MAG TPA: hypothetical protein VEU96_28210 [Bryobacteraceae bacterium]|nr:hypothetical protein [Bryobacteraceae bacterium]